MAHFISYHPRYAPFIKRGRGDGIKAINVYIGLYSGGERQGGVQRMQVHLSEVIFQYVEVGKVEEGYVHDGPTRGGGVRLQQVYMQFSAYCPGL